MSTRDRSIAICGCIQHAWWAHRLAQHGEYRADRLNMAADSILCTDPEDAVSVFGNLENLKTGIEVAIQLFSGREEGHISVQESALITGYAGNLLRLGTAVTNNAPVRHKLTEGIAEVKASRSGEHADQAGDTAQIEALTRQLAGLYTESISPLAPRIMIQGNGIYLRNEQFAAGIRTHLLAAVRAAVLWRQCGGRLWLMMFQRSAYLRAIRQLAALRSP